MRVATTGLPADPVPTPSAHYGAGASTPSGSSATCVRRCSLPLMTALEASRVVAVQPGEGRSADQLGGFGTDFKLMSADTGGQVAVVEHPFAVGTWVPPHSHSREDEFSIVVEGEIGFRSEDDEVVLGAGGYIVKPRHQVHAMWNAGRVPARMIEIISPGGFEGFFADLADLVEAGTMTEDGAVVLAERYGLRYHDPAWMADVIRRYDLTVR